MNKKICTGFALALSASFVWAASTAPNLPAVTSSSGVTVSDAINHPVPKPTSKGKAPLGAPPVTDVSEAYAFRTQLKGDPQCQRFASESDAIFLDGAKSDDLKVSLLKSLGAQAAATGCLSY